MDAETVGFPTTQAALFFTPHAISDARYALICCSGLCGEFLPHQKLRLMWHGFPEMVTGVYESKVTEMEHTFGRPGRLSALMVTMR